MKKLTISKKVKNSNSNISIPTLWTYSDVWCEYKN